jgi:predicted nucleic acid-binding protein
LRPVYLDANAIVKRYAYETGSERVGLIYEAADDVFTCKVAFAEVLATFRRKRDELPAHGLEVDRLTNQFRHDWGAMIVVDLTAELVGIVLRLAFQHSLKALDLLHLAAALLLRDEVRIPLAFISSDQALLAAARRERLDVFDPERDDSAQLDS